MSIDNDNEIKWEELKNLSAREIEKESRKILSIMTLEEKVNQMSGDATIFREGLSMLKRYNAKPITAGTDRKLGILGIKFTDGPRGVVMGNSTCFPVSMARGATWDIDLEQKVGDIIGIEAKAQGANFFGGVCINLLRHPLWGRAQETYGEDPIILGKMGVALLKGVQKHIMACAKHYAANSIENARFKIDVRMDERTLREVYLPHFKRCVKEGVASIMSAYNKVNGEYCGHNSHLLREILKNDWKFEGFVITDFIWGIRNGKKAVNAGVDIEMPFRWKMKPNKLINLVKNKEIPVEYIDDAVFRILRQKLRFNYDEDPNFYNKNKIACEEHAKIALEVARKSIVLLKNENKLLPLNRNKIKKIAVIGKFADRPNIGDHGSSRVYPPYVITPLQGIIKAAGNSIEVIYSNGKNIKGIKENIKDADAVIIIAGYSYKDEGENIFLIGGDRKSLELRPYDQELIIKISEINKNCIVALEGGSAIIIESWKEKIPAILMMWYPGMEGGTALGEIIFGDINPSGKLPIVFPKSLEQLPFFSNKVDTIEYGYFHGYKLIEKNNDIPAFPFGFGLSYTTYSYNNLRLDKTQIDANGEITIKVDITNKGPMDGEEIVQLYIGYKNSKINRPVKDLKDFQRIKLDNGETKTVEFKLKASDLAYYDINTSSWKIEEIQYIVYVGPSSRSQDLLTAKFNLSV
ncbi:MAG: beta-glucosidase family protein [Candidatus Helarchaeota archaeon]